MTPQSRSEAIERLYRAHATRLRRALTRRVRTDADVIEDASAFAWEQLLRHPEVSTRDERRVLAWLATTAYRHALALAARQQRTPTAASIDIDHLAGPTRCGSDLHETRVEQLHQLSARQQRFLLLQAAGYPVVEISQREHTTPRTVERQLLRARKTLNAADEVSAALAA